MMGSTMTQAMSRLLAFDALASGVEVVVGQDDGVVEDGGKYAGRVGDGVGVGERPGIIQGRLAADGEAVGPAVVATLELHDLPASGVGAGHAHGILEGVGAGIAEGGHLRAGDDLAQLPCQLDL